MRDSLIFTRNAVHAAPPTLVHQHSGNGMGSGATGLYSSLTSTQHNVSDFIVSRNPIADSSTEASRGVLMDSTVLHDNLYLHPEVHNPIHHHHNHHTHQNGRDTDNGHSHKTFQDHNGNGGGAFVFGQVTIEVSADELISDGIAATRLGSMFGSILFLMSCVGLYHPSSEDVTPERDTCFSGSWCLRVFLMVWSVAVGVYLLFNTISIGYYVDTSLGLDILSVTELVVVLRLAKALLVVVVFFVIFESTERYDEMLETWCVWLRWQTDRDMSHSRKWVFVITCLTLTYATVPSVLAGLGVFGHVPHMALRFTAFAVADSTDQLLSWHQALRVNFTIAITLANIIMALFCGFFVAVCSVLSYEMRLLAREIQVEVRGQAVIWDMKIEPHSGQEVTVLEFLRRKHGKLTGVVQAVDHSFRELLFFHYVVGIPVIIFDLYIMLAVSPVGYISYKGTILMFTILSLVEMFIIWLAAVDVHIWAHQPTKILPTIDIHERKEITHAHQTSLHFFLDSLTTEKIGMTLWGIVPLTKEFIVVMVTISILLRQISVFIVTYLVILTDLPKPLPVGPPMMQQTLESIRSSTTVGQLQLSTDHQLEAVSPSSFATSVNEGDFGGPYISPRNLTEFMLDTFGPDVTNWTSLLPFLESRTEAPSLLDSSTSLRPLVFRSLLNISRSVSGNRDL